MAMVTLIQKVGFRLRVYNYRPVSVLSIHAWQTSRLSRKKKKLFMNINLGFKKNKSKTIAIFDLHTRIVNELKGIILAEYS